jgi:hypothetical protein
MNLDNLEALAKAATPGPWRYTANGIIGSDAMPDEQFIVLWDDDGRNRFNDYPFIAASNPETILALIDLVREMGEVLENLEKVKGRHHTEQAYNRCIEALAKYKDMTK